MSHFLSFHQGELAVQAMANESDIAKRNGGVISDSILGGAIPFIAQQTMLVVSSIDEAGQPWSSILFGKPGFIQASSDTRLTLDTTKILLNSHDPFWRNIEKNQQVGVLAIELSTRRRFRVNGRIQALDRQEEGAQFEITVQQAYPNCPKFIQRRNLTLDPKAFSVSLTEPLPEPHFGQTLNNEQQDIIQRADSFFVSSCSPFVSHGDDDSDSSQKPASRLSADASHRGGLPGFIKLIEGNTLLIPDYKGNSMFNTLGNIHQYPKAGIIIPDFDNARVLQLTGQAEILWNQQDETNHSAGTKRFWTLKVEAWQETPITKHIDWHFQDYSPHNPREKTANVEGQRDANKAISMRVAKVVQKSPRIKLFRLIGTEASLKGKHKEVPLPEFDAGAHLPVELVLADGKKVIRHYSILSSVKERDYYEIAVQREDGGRGGSLSIHERLEVSSQVLVWPPKSEFPLIRDDKHKILIAGGIGITPMLSMLRELIVQQASFEFHYTARSEADLAFKQEVFALAGNRAFFYSSDTKRLDLEHLISHAKSQSHVYLCGPLGLINQVREITKAQHWLESRVHFESFGSASQPGDKAIELKLKKSNQVIMVDPKESILDALSQNKVAIPYDCKRGECGLCVTTFTQGEADHRDFYLSKTEQKQQMCVCVSRAKGDSLTLDL